MVALQLLVRLHQRFVTVVLLRRELSDFRLDRFVGQLRVEHLLLLVHELLHVLGPLVAGELHSAACDVDCGVDVGSIFAEVVVHNFFAFGSRYVGISDSAKRCSRRCRVLVPNLLVL